MKRESWVLRLVAVGIVVVCLNTNKACALDSLNVNIMGSCFSFIHELCDVIESDSIVYTVDAGLGLHIYDVRDLSDPELLGTYRFCNDDSKPAQIQLYEQYLFIACFKYDSSTLIIDISDPQNPVMVGEIPDIAGKMVIDGEVLYIADNAGIEADGLKIFDISDPLEPEQIGQTNVYFYGYLIDMELVDQVIIIPNRGNTTCFIDVSDPYNPNLISTLVLPFSMEVASDNGYAYIVSGAEGMWPQLYTICVVNISDPGNPIIENEIEYWQASNLAAKDGYMYLTISPYHQYLWSADISSPPEIDLLEPVRVYGFPPLPIVITEQFLIAPNEMSDFTNDMKKTSVDLYDPSSPEELTELGEITNFGSLAEFVISDNGNYVYMFDRNVGLRIVNVSDPFNPFSAGSVELEAEYVSWDNLRIGIKGDYVYVLHIHAPENIEVIDVSDPYSPEVVYSMNVDDPVNMKVSGDYLHLLTEDSYQIFDLNIQPELVNVSTQVFPNTYSHIDIADNKAFLVDTWTTGDNLVTVFDLTNINEPTMIGNSNVLGNYSIGDMWASDSLLFFESGQLYIYDFSDVNNPVQVATLNIEAGELVVADNSLLTIQADVNRLQIRDISDFEEIEVVGYYKINYPIDIAYRNSKAYISNPASLGIYDVSQVVSVDEFESINRSLDFSLEPVYPNPFNHEVVITFNLNRAGAVELGVYDVLGREVARLVDGYIKMGQYQVNWNAEGAASGIYLVRLENGANVQTRKMVLVK